MAVLLIIVCFLLLGAGMIFSVLPPLPGPILSYIAVLISHFFIDKVQFSTWGLVLWAIVVVIVTILDYVLPVIATKKFGGTKWGVWGGMIGMVMTGLGR